MYSLILTLIFYLLAGLIVLWKVPKQIRLLAWGSLPVAWISFLALAGLIETILLLPSIIPLLALLAGMIFFVLRLRSGGLKLRSIAFPSIEFWILFLFFLGVSMVAFQVHLRAPLGGWDTMFTWILRTRFLVDGGEIWRQGFSNDLALLHPDYPPMFSWALVPLWKLDGSQSSLAVASLLAPFFSGWMLILAGWWNLVDKRSSWWGRLTVAIVLATPFIIYLYSAKSLDFVVSFSILTSLAWHAYAQKVQSKKAWIFCAFMVAWSALVKNEGQLWIVSFIGALLVLSFLKEYFHDSENVNKKELSKGAIFLAILQGMFIPIVFLIWFKVSLAPPNDLIEPQRAFEISQVIQPEVFFNPYSLLVRIDQAEQWEWHQLIWKQFWNVSLDWKTVGILIWAIPLFFVVNLFKGRETLPWMLLAIGIQLIGYYGVYLLTPYNPYWHVSTSMNRLLMHIAPAALCLLGFNLCRWSGESEGSGDAVSGYHTFFQRGLLSLPLVSVLFCYSQLHNNAFMWNFQSERMEQEEQLSELDFPRVAYATFVTSNYEPATFYRMQFVSVPTILVVDRRERILLASFSNEQELKTYCEQNRWKLKNNRKGFGWAESLDANGPLPHMEKIRVPNE